jgi:hypothetical protein
VQVSILSFISFTPTLSIKSNLQYDDLSGSPNAPFALKFAAGAASGSIGSCVGNPWDVLKTMMQANKGKSVSLSHLASKLYADQGVGGFYRGIQANIARACVLNGTKMAVYDVAKGYVSSSAGWTRKDPRTIFCSATISGFFMTCTVSPFDMLRTRLMNQPTDKKLYNGFVDAAVKVLKTEGPGAFYRGFFPIWARFAPTATLVSDLHIFSFDFKVSNTLFIRTLILYIYHIS